MATATLNEFMQAIEGATGKDAAFFTGIIGVLERNSITCPNDLKEAKFEDLSMPEGALTPAQKAHVRRALKEANKVEARRASCRR